MEKNVAGQKWYIKAWDETNNTVKVGDAANITANLRLDGGIANAVDDVNPTELEGGYYVFDITQAESNADYILICPSSATVNIQVEGCPKAFTTTAPNSNLLGIESDGDLTKVNTLDGHTAQTGDNFARIGAPVAASISADIAVADGNIDTLITRVPSEVAQKTHLVNGTGDITPPVNKGIWDSLGDGTKSISGLHDFDPDNDDVANVVHNEDMRGSDNAANGAVWNIDKAKEIEDIKIITDQISFDASGNVNTSISRPTGTVVVGASNNVSSFVTDLAQTADDYWLNAWVKFTSGNLINQVRKVQGYNGTTKVLSFYSPYTETPAAGDDFELIVE